MELYNDELYFYINDKPLGMALKDFKLKNSNVYPFVRFNSNSLDNVELLGGTEVRL